MTFAYDMLTLSCASQRRKASNLEHTLLHVVHLEPSLQEEGYKSRTIRKILFHIKFCHFLTGRFFY